MGADPAERNWPQQGLVPAETPLRVWSCLVAWSHDMVDWFWGPSGKNSGADYYQMLSVTKPGATC